jgi:RNA polymerase sigma-70 factor, ECF subfamily
VGLRAADEEQLLRRVAGGERAAFEEFYRRTSPWLLLRLRRRCADEQLVAEVLQETYLSVWQAAGSFVGATAGGWLWTIAARRLVDAFRREGRNNQVPALPEDVAPPAEETALAGALSGEVGAALGGLSRELRQVLRAMVLDGLSVRETSVLLGIPEGTVKTRARRARIAMREAMS